MEAPTTVTTTSTILPEKVRAVPQWQTDDDIPYRRQMIARLIQHRPDMDSAKRFKLPNLAKRIELVLYRSAYSLDEYNDMTTLERRVQSLVMQLYGKINAEMDQATTASPTAPKTKKRGYCYREPLAPVVITKKPRVIPTEAPFLFNDQYELIQRVYAFVDGQNAMRHMSVNRMAAKTLPLVTRSLRLSMTQIRIPGTMTNILSKCPNVETIELNGASVLGGPVAYSAKDLAARKLGEHAIMELSDALAHGCAPQLRALHLNKLYQNTVDRDGTAKLVQALAKGHQSKLASLRLGGNMIGDTRAVLIAELMTSGVLANLRVLDLHENFIGERGATALFAALKAKVCPSLTEFDLSGNILTDRDGRVLAECLASEPFANLKQLIISKNYIGSEGFYAIARALQRPTYRNLAFKCEQTQITPTNVAMGPLPLYRAHSI